LTHDPGRDVSNRSTMAHAISPTAMTLRSKGVTLPIEWDLWRVYRK
jgi:hypothetical protein